ncbi:MAG: hypothetical protein JF888_12405 [Candidatus Dormibacteraeota bacterium]|uniref:Uncharacterized protein n=1 Tax=Candidatus Dormiibacter inghamiae TaxID=3127013 RepID=A0A934KI76_9BACT|nr:hypothetical protein [Candidatus Dormibacteraeota bacterium]MBJ7604764.1 hypothetical protein [Candidatus Dormibacteraeota bacterium]
MWPSRQEPHESGVRSLVHGDGYTSYRSLAEAQADPDGIVVLEGDDGGQIYLTVPASDVRCSDDRLEELLREIDAAQWKDPTMAQVYYERRPLDGIVSGGMGGGEAKGRLWIHGRLQDRAARIASVLDGSSV